MNRAELRRGMRLTTGWRGKKARRRKPVPVEVQQAFRAAVKERTENIDRLTGRPEPRELWTP